MKIVLTPINTKDNLPYNSFSKNARDDYYYEKQFFESDNEEYPIWDNTKNNSAKIGYKFGFVNYREDKIEIFDIIDILSNENRRVHWNLRSHLNRNVLKLSKKVDEISFIKYKKDVGYKENYTIRGTCLGKWIS